MHMFLWLIYIAGLTRSRIWTPTPMATLHYAEVFILHRARFRFQSQLPTTGMGLESESVPESISCNVNGPLSGKYVKRKHDVTRLIKHYYSTTPNLFELIILHRNVPNICQISSNENTCRFRDLFTQLRWSIIIRMWDAHNALLIFVCLCKHDMCSGSNCLH